MKSSQIIDTYSALKMRLEHEPMIMGILNVTPDSFSDGGRYFKRDEALRHALHLIEEGADIIDVGGESSRPGAEPVSGNEEIDRVIPVIEDIRANSDILLSIDTYKSSVARAALEAGVNWINDVSALRFDPEMPVLAGQYQCPVVVMHMRGEPRTMQQNPSYNDVIGEVKSFFLERLTALKAEGVSQVIVDPGIGFGKRLEDNLRLLAHLNQLITLNCPLMIGVSRKSFIGALTGQPVEDREDGTLAASLWSYQQGVRIFRTHAVGPLKVALKIVKSISENVNQT